MRILVTGATGFIGHHIALALYRQGHILHLATRHPNKIKAFQNKENIKIFEAALNEPKKLLEAAKNCDACIHIALGYGNTPLTMLENDTKATITLLEIAEIVGLKKWIYTSSTAAMGKFRNCMNESSCNLPLDLYGATKAASEAYVLGCKSFLKNAGNMQRNIIRPGYTFGNPAFLNEGFTEPDMRFKNIISAAKNNRDIHIIKNDGTQFIHVSQLTELYLKVLESSYNEEIFLGLGANWISWKEIALKALELCPYSKSKIIEKDLGWSKKPMLFSVQKINDYFGLQFNAMPFIEEHLQYFLTHEET